MVLCSRSSPARDSSGSNTGKTNLIEIKLCSTLALTLLLNASLAAAQESQVAPNLDEDFLNYLADMSIQEGKIIDQLDMLNLEKEIMPNEYIQGDSLEKVVRETRFNPQPAKVDEINVKFKNEDFGSDEQEEQQ